MNEVERLNYVNGRRLRAGDFQLEQDYLVEMRRRLNRGLFTPGVVNGCRVRQPNGSTTQIEIERGLALDPKGRELVITSTVTLSVPSRPPVTRLNGYFLVMTYGEERLTGEDPDCGPPIREAARVREQPEFHWTESLPSHALCRQGAGTPLDCGIVLALVSVEDCEITLVDTTLRQLANPTNLSQATAYALEGEKDIDAANPKMLHFQIRGGSPSAVTLYLWAEEFSSLHYTEVGEHRHTLQSISLTSKTVDLGSHTHDISGHAHGLAGHSHNLDGLQPDPNVGVGAHGHAVKVNAGDGFGYGFRIATRDTDWLDEIFGSPGSKGFWYRESPSDGNSPENFSPPYLAPSPGITFRGTKTDAVTGDTGLSNKANTGGPSVASSAVAHTHELSQPATVAFTGSSGPPVRGGAAYDHFSALNVELDGAPITTEILRGLPAFNGMIGSGSSGHDLVRYGTGAIDLLDVGRAVGKTLGEGSHTLKFFLDPPPPGPPPAHPNGGKLLYNLYVE